MVSSDMDISEKLKSLSIDRSAAVRSTGGWRLPAMIVGGVALIAIAWAVFGRGNGPAETPVEPASISAPSTASAAQGTTRPRGGLVASGYVAVSYTHLTLPTSDLV